MATRRQIVPALLAEGDTWHTPSLEEVWGQPPPLPPWIAENKRERKAMELWVNWHLDFLRGERTLDPTFGGAGSAGQWLAELAAWHGNMQPLRSMYPRLAPFLHPPKRKRGEYPRRRPRQYAIEQAVADVARIRALWLLGFGRKNRRDRLAVEIAAARWNVDPEVVERELK